MEKFSKQIPRDNPSLFGVFINKAHQIRRAKLNALKILEVIWRLSIIKRLRVKSSEPLLFLVGDTGFEPVTSSV